MRRSDQEENSSGRIDIILTISRGLMNIYYASSRYRSHYRIARIYKSLIGTLHTLVNDLNSAEVVFLHIEPHDYGALYSRYPQLKDRYVIAYCVWEASELSDSYQRSLSYVQEIWTCSTYCCNVFKKHHKNVVRIPHPVARMMTYTSADELCIRKKMGYEVDTVYYLSLTKLWDKRKNTDFLIEAFKNKCYSMPKARLVIKANPGDRISPVADPRIIFIRDELTESELNALYCLSHVYVSAHHSEGWGLPLSDAILFEKPVIATGYSGNLDFMTGEDSFFIKYVEDNIRPIDCFGAFQTSMKWAYPDLYDLEQQLVWVYDSYADPCTRRMISSAKDRVTSYFNLKAVKHQILRRLDIVNQFVGK